MSRVGQQPVEIPAGVKVAVADSRVVKASGPQGDLSFTVPDPIRVEMADGKLMVRCPGENVRGRSLHGMSRSMVQGMLLGVAKGYSRTLEVQGVGFRAAVQGQKLSLWLGFSRPLEYEVPQGVKVAVPDGTTLVISGPDKTKVGDVAARLVSFFPAEPYKGKGVRHKGAYVRRKVGKTVA